MEQDSKEGWTRTEREDYRVNLKSAPWLGWLPHNCHRSG